jgi:hypothetical protein
MSCINAGFQHCLFNDKLPVKGHAERVTDSTTYFPEGDSLSNTKLLDVNEADVTADGEWHGGYRLELDLYDTNDIDSSFDLMGKFSRDRLFQLYNNNHLTQKQTNYIHNRLYNTEDDYVSSATGATYLRYKYKYDDNCNLLQLDQMNEDLSVEKKYIFQYNDKHNLTECKVYNGSSLLLKQVKYGYDKNNNEIGYTIYDTKKKVAYNFNFTYHEYDTIGNWQKRVKYKNNKLVAVTQRHIKYF